MRATREHHTTPINMNIEEDIFFKYCRRLTESNSTSPSGRHCGHYKSISTESDIIRILHSVITLAIETNHIHPRWKTIHHTILEKIKSTPKIHRLLNVWIVEADLNFMISYIWGKKLNRYEETHKLLRPIKFLITE